MHACVCICMYVGISLKLFIYVYILTLFSEIDIINIGFLDKLLFG